MLLILATKDEYKTKSLCLAVLFYCYLNLHAVSCCLNEIK